MKTCSRVMGERHGSAKLTAGEVIAIRSWKGRALQREVAERYGISREHVRDIQNGASWGWLAP